MDEYREALQRLVNAIQFCERPALIQEARVLEPAIDAAKALLARGEPEPVDRLYQLLVVRGYAQHEAFAIAHGPPLSVEPAAADEVERLRSVLKQIARNADILTTNEIEHIARDALTKEG